MTNLYIETIDVLANVGKTIDDIVWVGGNHSNLVIPVPDLKLLFDIEYGNGFGAQEIASDLVIVGVDWWLMRTEYDGSECWEYHTLPIQPKEKILAKQVKVNDSQVGWQTLAEIASDNEN